MMDSRSSIALSSPNLGLISPSLDYVSAAAASNSASVVSSAEPPELLQKLHRFLDPEQVIRCFARALAEQLRFVSASYSHQQLKLRLGKGDKNGIQYKIPLEQSGHALGTLKYRFSQVLNPEQLQLFRRLHDILRQPLFNAWQFASLKVRLDEEPLTGLQNRASFDRHLGELTACNSKPLCLLLLDLDHFKAVNDNHGHAEGDQVLRQTAETLRAAIRPTDQAFRFGGDEFALLLETDLAGGQQIAERVLQKLHQSPLCTAHGITASIGVCERRDEERANQLFARCDSALYQSKANGRNGFTLG